MKKLLFTILVCLAFLSYSVYGCSVKPEPLKEFDSSEYIFIGEVIGYTDPIEFKRDSRFKESNDPRDWNLKWTQGLRVKLKTAINLPKTPKTHFEVFPFDSDGACKPLGIPIGKIQRWFPINSEILVIASEATLLPHILPDGNFRLQDSRVEDLIALNTDENNQRLISSNTIFDYKTNFEKKKDHSAAIFASRIDLLRFKNAENDKERREVLERLFYLRKSYNYVDLYTLSRQCFSNVDEAEEFFRKSISIYEFPENIIQEEVEKRRKKFQAGTSEKKLK